MPDIRHRVGIAAPQYRVYEMLATKGGLAKFWTSQVEGDSFRDDRALRPLRLVDSHVTSTGAILVTYSPTGLQSQRQPSRSIGEVLGTVGFVRKSECGREADFRFFNRAGLGKCLNTRNFPARGQQEIS